MRIALDAMGGDHAPAAMVEGGVDFARAHPRVTVVLVGLPYAIQRCLDACGSLPENLEIHEATQVIGMADKITALKEKPDDSMNACARLVKQGKADAMVLCGNTGCSVASAQLHWGRLAGVKRAGILTPLPNISGFTWVIDCGANSVGKPEHLAQFGEMAAVFVDAYQGLQGARVGVLCNGEEDGKGTDLTAGTLAMLRQTNLNIIGYVEGNDIFKGTVDVVVCDGFTGNILLKASEGLASAVGSILKEGIMQSLRCKIGAWLMKPAFAHLRERTSWRRVGGCMLVGVDGICIIGHGRSQRDAVASALGQAMRCVDQRVVERMRLYLGNRNIAHPHAPSIAERLKGLFARREEHAHDRRRATDA